MRSSEVRSFGIFQLIVLVLSVYALAALLVDAFVPLRPEASRLIQMFDYLVCAVFFADFVHQLYVAENKLKYLKTGWIDLLASIPTVDAFRWGRVLRIFRILRVLRALRGTQKLYLLLRNRKSVGGSLSLGGFMLVVFCSMAILVAEQAENSNIQTAGDALWWSLATVTTVGYGDLYPVTPTGRLLGAGLMLGGIGMFGSFAALVAAYFTGKEVKEESDPMVMELRALRMEVQALREKLGERGA